MRNAVRIALKKKPRAYLLPQTKLNSLFCFRDLSTLPIYIYIYTHIHLKHSIYNMKETICASNRDYRVWMRKGKIILASLSGLMLVHSCWSKACNSRFMCFDAKLSARVYTVSCALCFIGKAYRVMPNPKHGVFCLLSPSRIKHHDESVWKARCLKVVRVAR